MLVHCLRKYARIRESYFKISIIIDSAKDNCDARPSALFKETGKLGMLGAVNYNNIDLVFNFFDEMVRNLFGYKSSGPQTEVRSLSI